MHEVLGSLFFPSTTKIKTKYPRMHRSPDHHVHFNIHIRTWVNLDNEKLLNSALHSLPRSLQGGTALKWIPFA
jgi:hypothetical protein